MGKIICDPYTLTDEELLEHLKDIWALIKEEDQYRFLNELPAEMRVECAMAWHAV